MYTLGPRNKPKQNKEAASSGYRGCCVIFNHLNERRTNEILKADLTQFPVRLHDYSEYIARNISIDVELFLYVNGAGPQGCINLMNCLCIHFYASGDGTSSRRR